MKHIILRLVIWLVIWRAALTFIADYTIVNFPYQPTFPYAKEMKLSYETRTLTTWAQFDGVHYWRIITNGYKSAALMQVFFPLYPLLVKLIAGVTGNIVLTGVSLSTICFGLGLYLLYRLIGLDESPRVAWRTIGLILLSPVAFYFSSLYTEGLFFLLVVAAFYAARKQQWGLAALAGGLAAATRLVGIVLIPALAVEYYLQYKQKLKPQLAAVPAPLLGLGAYMIYLQKVFHDPLMFYHAQAEFGTARDTNRIILLYQVFYRYLKMFFTVSVNTHLYAIVWQEFLSALLSLILLALGWLKTRRSYVIYGFLVFIIPTLTGTFSSLPRYLLPVFPIYLVAAKVLPTWMYYVVLVISGALLVANVFWFSQGLWVA